MKKIFQNNIFWSLIIVIASGALIYFFREDLLSALWILLAALVIILVLYNFEAGIFLLLLSLVVGQILRITLTQFGGSMIASDLMVFLLGIVWISKKIIFKERITSPKLSWSVLIFSIWIVISNLFSLNYFSGREVLVSSFYFIRWLLYFFVFIITYNQDLKKNFSKYLNWFVAFVLFISGLGFLQLIFVPDFSFMRQFGWDPHVGRLLSTFFDPNLLGGFLDLAFGAALGLFLSVKDKKNKFWYGIATLIIFIAIVLTFSRSAYLGLVVIFFVITLIRSRKVAVMGIILMAIVFFSVPKSIDRVKSAFEFDKTSQARVESWAEGWEIAKTHPLIGVGFDNLPYIKVEASVSGNELDHTAAGIDSSLLTILTTTGFVGLGLYLIIYFGLIINNFKLAFAAKSLYLQGLSLGLAAGLLGLLVHSQFVNSLLYAPIMIAIWFLVGLVYGQAKIEKSSKLE